MVRISKFRLREEILIRLYQLFFEVMSRSAKKDWFFEIINEIFSPTEKIMIAKRITIIYLLIKGIDQAIIANTIKVSTGTVSKYAVMFYNKNTKLVELIRKMITEEKVLNFLDDVFADIFIQPGIQMGHWNLYWQHKRRKDRRKATGL
jgi:Trp operon repressor